MHIERFTDRDRRVVYTTVTGEITAKEIFADIKRLSTDPSFDPGMAGFVDMRKATAHLAANEIQRIAYIVKTNPRIAGPTRRALLVSTDLLYGIYRMFEAYAAGGPTDYRVFRNEQEAREWINPATAQVSSPAQAAAIAATVSAPRVRN